MLLENSMDSINNSTIVKITGVISNYRKERKFANFFFKNSDKKIMGLAAIAGALAGAAGQAAGNTRDAANLQEEADYIEMMIDNRPVKGWVWFSPFRDGDIVEVIGTQKENYFEAIAICRPNDRVIALYPHCSRGKNAHIQSVTKWWLSLTALAIGFGVLIDTGINYFSSSKVEYIVQTVNFIYVTLGIYALSGAFAYTNGKRFMLFVHAATQVFKTIGLDNPDSVDLPKRTKRKPGDPGVLGVMYFNY